MHKKIYYCDRCGKQIQSVYNYDTGNEKLKIDFCNECYYEFKKWLEVKK